MLWFGALAGAVVLSIVAVMYHLDQLFYIAATLGTAPWLSWYLSYRGMSQVRASVQTAGTIRLSVGEERSLRVLLYNHGRLPKLLCRASLRLPRGLVEVSEQSLQADTLAPGATAHADVRFRGIRRGCYAIREAEIRSSDQLGIFEFPARVPDVDVDVTVWPRRVPARQARWILERAAVNGPERTTSSRRGAGLEFYGVREWSPGDDLRRVHWPSTARRGTLAVIEFDRDASHNLTIILDLGTGRHSGGGQTSTLEWSVSFAATLASHAIEAGGTTGLIARGAEDYSLCAREGILEVESVLDHLAAVRDGASVPLDQVIAQRLTELQVAGAVIVTPKFDDQVYRSALLLRRVDADVVILVVSEQQAPGLSLARGIRTAVFRPGVDDPVTFLEGGAA